MAKTHKIIIIIASCAFVIQLISLFLPHQFILHRFGDDEPYPPEPQYAHDLILPLLLFCFSAPLFLRLIKKQFKSTFRLALGLFISTMIVLFLLSPFVGLFVLNTVEIGIGAYLSVFSAVLFFSISLKKGNARKGDETQNLLDSI